MECNNDFRPGLLQFVFLILLVGCTSTTPAATPAIISVQYTQATQPWLMDMSLCSSDAAIQPDLRAVDYQDLQSADLAIRLGPSGSLSPYSYQIGKEDILAIGNPQNTINKLSAEQVRGLFTGQIGNWHALGGPDAPVQVWVFSAGEDIEKIFEQSFLAGSPVTSLANLATSPDEMTKAVSNDIHAIGIISRRLQATGNMEVLVAASALPVLAFSRSEPKGELANLLACLQK